jgi:manganese oxidase
MQAASASALAASLTAFLLLAGCLGDTAAIAEPGRDVKETGRTIHLKAKVVDYANHTIYPGLKANLWAFCFEPFDPSDAASAAAIEPVSHIGSDALDLGPEDKAICGVPGPTIRVKQGDRVIVEFSHSHVHPHTIHWHGQLVPYESDGAPGVTQDAVKTGESITYDFIAKKAGTLWYHCHVDTQLHVMQGLYGVFIVEPADPAREPEVDREYVLVLSTARREVIESIPGISMHAHPPGCYISGTPDCQNPPVEATPDVFMVNGRSYPLTMEDPASVVKVKPGGATRVRVLNAGTTFETLHPHGQDMLVTHRDGTPLPQPFWVDTLSIGPAERYDVVIHGTNPGVWMMHTHVNDHETNDGQSPGGMHTMLVYDGHEEHLHPYKAELPGGFPYEEPRFLPRDRDLYHSADLGAAPQAPVPGAPAPVAGASVQWSFPVELACATQTVMVRAELSGSQAALSASQLTVTIRDPAGTTVFSGPLGRDASNQVQTVAQWLERQAGAEPSFNLPAGNYTVAVAGSAALVGLALEAHVDYFDSTDEMKVSHRLHKTPYCGTYGNVGNNNGAKVPPL